MDNFLIHARFFSLFAFYPREIECIMDAGAQKVYHAVGRLGGGKIASRFGMRAVHREEVCPSATVEVSLHVVGEQALHRPSFAVVIR